MAESISVSRAYWQARDAEKDTPQKPTRQPLGLSSFNAEEQHAFGRKVRLAMALMEDPAAASQLSQPDDDPEQSAQHSDVPDAIVHRLRALCREGTCNLAEQLELMLQLDETRAWQPSGAVHCCAWMSQELGIGESLGWEYLRVARKLRDLPLTRALFRAGRLSWSIVRRLSRVATVENEQLLCHSALDASVSEVERLCAAYRWNDTSGNGSTDGDCAGNDALDEENQRAMQQFDARSFTWRKASNGNTEFRLCLPPDRAEAFLNSIEHSLSRLPKDREQHGDDAEQEQSEPTDTMSQKRADAAVAMAEASLQSDNRDVATADRYQVLITVDADELSASSEVPSTGSTTPSRRPILQGHTPIARETARRHACDCSVSRITMSGDGEPIDIGRKSRIWPAAMVRAIKARDQHCQFPGCTASRHLQIHHIEHWADGGSTRVENGVCLCARHHTFVHEGGYRLERVSHHPDGSTLQFERQRQAPPEAPAEEIALRQSRESFNRVRMHAPERFRFRIAEPG